MRKSFKRYTQKVGLPPGTLLHVGDKKIERTRITVINYDKDHLQEREVPNSEDFLSIKNKSSVTWINIDGLHDISVIEKIGNCFNLHPLTLEDILNTTQRAKYEDFEDYIVIILKMLSFNDGREEIDSEQVSLILGKDYIISFQERIGDVFDLVRERIRVAKGHIRRSGPDYLAHALLDAIVDNYFVVLENLGDKIGIVEENLVKKPSSRVLGNINTLKGEMVFLRKSVWPLREVVSSLERGGSPLISETTQIYLRDLYDNTIQAIDTIESFRDTTSGMLEIYLSSISYRMNDVMKTLTIIATIFIPLTFITSIYGMNFNPQGSKWNMPELNWRYGYMLVWIVMTIIAIFMIYCFKRKKWF
ncbi:MAG: magnesium/cobalt transporter CorA [bacterium]